MSLGQNPCAPVRVDRSVNVYCGDLQHSSDVVCALVLESCRLPTTWPVPPYISQMAASRYDGSNGQTRREVTIDHSLGRSQSSRCFSLWNGVQPRS
jgi:hypothetical protein